MHTRVTAGAAVIATVLVAGCKFPPPPDVPDDADGLDAATDHALGGSLSGLWHGSGVVSRLEAEGVDERVTENENGAFVFANRLRPSSPFVITVAAQPTQQMCSIVGGTAVVANVDVAVSVTCTPAFALDITLGAPLDWTFDPTVTSYQLVASFMSQASRVTVTCPTASTIRVNGSPAASGISTAPIAIAPDSNTILVDVVVGSLSQQYAFGIDRGASPIRQGMYGKASNADPGDRFGAAISVDGDRIAVAAPAEDSARDDTPADNSRPDAGAVYIFKRRGTQWSQEAYIKSPSLPSPMGFGTSVALHGDVLAVGYAQQVRVFRRSPNGWAFAQQVTSDGDEGFECFGAQVRLLGDVLVVAAPCEASSSQGVNGSHDNQAPNSGALYVFRWNGVVWLQEAFLKPTGRLNPNEPELGLRGLALASDVIAGTFVEDAGPRVQVYRRVGGTWMVDGVLVPSDGYHATDGFGDAVGATADTIIVGAPGEDSAATGIGGNRLDNSVVDSGAVYVFRRRASGWMDEGYLKSSNTDVSDQFGARLGFAGDVLAVSSPGEDGGTPGVDGVVNDTVPESGAVYAFRQVNDIWMPPRYIKASNPGTMDRFGAVLGLSMDSLVVGSELEDSDARGIDGNQASDAARDSGAVYVFR